MRRITSLFALIVSLSATFYIGYCVGHRTAKVHTIFLANENEQALQIIYGLRDKGCEEMAKAAKKYGAGNYHFALAVDGDYEYMGCVIDKATGQIRYFTKEKQ